MNKIKVFLFVIMYFLQSFSVEKYVIGVRRGAGFFSSFFHVLMHLIGCKKNNLVPVVYWNHQSPYYVEKGNQYNNVWEYYFEPVSNLCYEKDDEIHRNHKCEYEHIPYIYAKMPNYKINFNYYFRQYMNNIIREHIKIKEPILEEVELFYRNYMKGKKVIGVHIRQTIDKLPETSLLDIDIFARVVSKYDGQILVASDQYIIIEKFKKKFPGRVICYDAHRSSGSVALHLIERDKKNLLNAIIGEEILIEAILLSRCDLFIHSVSNVATAVLFFNPDLKHIFLDPKKLNNLKIPRKFFELENI